MRTLLLLLFITLPGYSTNQTPSSLPAGLAVAIDNARLSVEPDKSGYRAVNAKQRFDLHFAKGGVASVRSKDSQVELRLSQWGRERQMKNAEDATVWFKGARIEYRRDGITEWFVNGHQALEQGFTIERRPDGKGAIRIELMLNGELVPRVESSTALVFEKDGEKEGTPLLRYHGLKAWDAAGRVLTSWMEAAGRRVSLVVDDADAVYPVTVDPYLAQAKLVPEDAVGGDWVGISVAIDGNTALVGATGAVGGASDGAVYVFVRNGAAWEQQAKLVRPPGDPDTEAFGEHIALSGDTAVIGTVRPVIPGGAGAIYVSTRIGASWSAPVLLDFQPYDSFGDSIAIDGDTIVAGSVELDFEGRGSVWVYRRNSGIWQREAILRASDQAPFEAFGSSVAIEGDTLVAGAFPLDEPAKVYVFERLQSTWTETAIVRAPDEAINALSGSVAISGDRLLLGSPWANTNGTAYTFTKSGGQWIPEARLVPWGPVDQLYFGFDVELRGDVAVVSASGEGAPGGAGAVYVFARKNGVWIQQSKLAPVTGEWLLGFGYYPDISLSGNTLLVGAAADDSKGEDSGAALVYTLPATCSLTLNATYTEPNVSVNYEIGNSVPGAWIGLLVTEEGVRTLWARQIGVVDPPQTGTVSVPASGGGASIVGLITQGGAPVCADVIGAGPGTGLSPERVRAIAQANGIQLP